MPTRSRLCSRRRRRSSRTSRAQPRTARQQPDRGGRRRQRAAGDVGTRHRPHLCRRRPDPPARNLLENAVVQLPGDPKGAGRRIAGKTIVIDLVARRDDCHRLTANENVQVDLPADGDLPGETDTLGIARRHRCARRGSAERHLCRQRRIPRDSRAARGNLPAVERIARFTVAHRRNQAGSRRGPAGGLSWQRALHRRSAGCRGRIAGALSCRPRSDRAIEYPGTRSGLAQGVGRASDRRGARHPVDARDRASSPPTRRSAVP